MSFMAVTLNVCLFKIEGQILRLRFICLNLKLYSAISDTKVKLFEQKIVLRIVFGSKKTFRQCVND